MLRKILLFTVIITVGVGILLLMFMVINGKYAKLLSKFQLDVNGNNMVFLNEKELFILGSMIRDEEKYAIEIVSYENNKLIHKKSYEIGNALVWPRCIFSTEGSLIAIGSSNYNLWFYDIKSNCIIKKIRFSQPCVRALLFSPNGKYLFVSVHDSVKNMVNQSHLRNIRIDISSWQITKASWADHIEYYPEYALFSNDGESLLIYDSGNMTLINYDQNRVVWKKSGYFNNAAFSRCGNFIFSDDLSRVYQYSKETSNIQGDYKDPRYRELAIMSASNAADEIIIYYFEGGIVRWQYYKNKMKRKRYIISEELNIESCINPSGTVLARYCWNKNWFELYGISD